MFTLNVARRKSLTETKEIQYKWKELQQLLRHDGNIATIKSSYTKLIKDSLNKNENKQKSLKRRKLGHPTGIEGIEPVISTSQRQRLNPFLILYWGYYVIA